MSSTDRRMAGGWFGAPARDELASNDSNQFQLAGRNGQFTICGRSFGEVPSRRVRRRQRTAAERPPSAPDASSCRSCSRSMGLRTGIAVMSWNFRLSLRPENPSLERSGGESESGKLMEFTVGVVSSCGLVYCRDVEP